MIPNFSEYLDYPALPRSVLLSLPAANALGLLSLPGATALGSDCLPGATREGVFVFNEKRSPADVRLKAALTDE
jgi:hypothetical protein